MQEIEATLIVCSESPLQVLANLAAVPSLGGYALQAPQQVAIHDYCLDTPDQRLHQADFTLRLRTIDSAPWLSMKGPTNHPSPGIAERSEVEMPWSREALDQIFGELASSGIRLLETRAFPTVEDPLSTLYNLGLELIQHRENQRRVRSLLSNEDGVLAEVSLDSVTYHFEGRKVRHYEVEIEAKSKAAAVLLPNLCDELIASYTGALQTWDRGKLATGRAIESLLVSCQLESLLGEDDHLKPAAYPLIHDFLLND